MSISNIITTIKNINLDQDCCARCKGKFENEESKKIVPFDDDDNFYCRRCAGFVFEERQVPEDDQDDVPCFPAKDNVPDIPPHKFIARDVDGVAWQYDAEDDEWTRSK